MQTPIYLAVTVDLMDLLLGLLILSGVAALIGLTVFLFRTAQTLRETSSLIKENRPAIKSTLDQLPELLEKVDIIVEDVSLITEQAGESVPGILEDVETVTGATADVVETIGAATVSVVDSVTSFFSGKGKHKSPKNTIQQIIAAINTIKRVAAIVQDKTKKSKKKKRKNTKKTLF
jgi:predicted PurR-regulated permease PerM